jgi:hypothetical protein
MDGSMSDLPGDAVGCGGKGSEVGLLADRFLVGLLQVRMLVKAFLWLRSTSNIWLVYNDFSSSANVQNPSWRPHPDGLQDRGGSRVTDGQTDG